MIIIYHCFGGSHSSVVAAAVHLGLLPEGRVPSGRELRALPLFDRRSPRSHGVILPLGRDASGHEVCVLGAASCFPVLRRAVLGVAACLGVGTHDVVFVDTLPCVNWLMRLGGVISRTLRLPWLGRPLVSQGARMAYRRLAALAVSTRDRLADPARAGSAPGPGLSTPARGGSAPT